METNAYYNGYLQESQEVLGDMMDYGINTCSIEAEQFFTMFISSRVAEQFEKGNPRYIAGMSGGELAKEVIYKVTGKEPEQPEEFYLDKSPEYWCGWALAFYQWKTGRSFKKIYDIVSIQEILFMYPTHHEADIERFVATMDQLYAKRHTKTYLQQFRENINMSVQELAEESGLRLSDIIELEKNFCKIMHTSAETVFHLSRILGCNMEDLLEI